MSTIKFRRFLVGLVVLLVVLGSFGGLSASFAQASMGTITGRVTGPDGFTPLEGVNLYSYKIDGENRYLWHSTQTGVDGIYTLVTEPGTYLLDFQDSRGRYASRFYVNATWFDDATPVAVAAGEVVSGINVSLGVGAHITGRVTGPDGVTPLAGIWVRSDLMGVPGLGVGDSDITDINGEYSLLEAYEGEYIVRFYDTDGPYLREFYDDAPTEYRATRIDVRFGETVSGIDASLALGGAIRGYILDDKGEPLDNPAAAILWQLMGDEWVEYGQSTSNAYGLFRFGGLYPGIYRLAIHYRSWEPTVWYDGAATLETATDIDLEPGTIFDQDILLSPNAIPTPAPPEIPEPATILLLSAGLAGLAAARVRRAS